MLYDDDGRRNKRCLWKTWR